MDGKTEIRILMQHTQERAVTTVMRIIEDAFEIAYRLVGVHTQK